MTSILRKLKLPAICLAIIALCSCSGIQIGKRQRVLNIELEQSFDHAISSGKSLFDPRSGTLYLMDSNNQQVQIWRKNTAVNRIGGMGVERDKFLRLSDIALDPDGGLLCLDAMAKVIKRFSTEGAYLGSIEISDTRQPELFTVATDFSLYIYDSATGEIVCYNALTMEESFRFGRFQLPRINSLSVARDLIVAYSSTEDLSYVFSSLGDLSLKRNGLALYDRFGNSFIWNGLSLKAVSSSIDEPDFELIPLDFSPNRALQISLSGDQILFTGEQNSKVYRIYYQGSYE